MPDAETQIYPVLWWRGRVPIKWKKVPKGQNDENHWLLIWIVNGYLWARVYHVHESLIWKWGTVVVAVVEDGSKDLVPLIYGVWRKFGTTGSFISTGLLLSYLGWVEIAFHNIVPNCAPVFLSARDESEAHTGQYLHFPTPFTQLPSQISTCSGLQP